MQLSTVPVTGDSQPIYGLESVSMVLSWTSSTSDSLSSSAGKKTELHSTSPAFYGQNMHEKFYFVLANTFKTKMAKWQVMAAMAQQIKAHLVEPKDLGWIPTQGRRTNWLLQTVLCHSNVCNPLPQTHTHKFDTFKNSDSVMITHY